MAALTLAINPGSSSREYALYNGTELFMRAYFEHEGHGCVMTLERPWQKLEVRPLPLAIFERSLAHFLEVMQTTNTATPEQIGRIGIRVVAPSRRMLSHNWFDEDLVRELEAKQAIVPLHIEASLSERDKASELIPHAYIVAVSDSAFHATLSHEARNYAIDTRLADRYDIYRFGYHGLSAASISRQLAAKLEHVPARVAICHLGSGASVTTLQALRSIDTTMGYSPLEGLIMATRSGSIDIAAALELKRRMHLSDEALIDHLQKHAGLFGLSAGQTNDIRKLLELESHGNEQAAFTLSSMVYRLRQAIAAAAANLGGLDAIVFTATVGERSAAVRARVMSGLGFLGVDYDIERNDLAEAEWAVVTKENSPCTVYVIETDETLEICLAAQSL